MNEPLAPYDGSTPLRDDVEAELRRELGIPPLTPAELDAEWHRWMEANEADPEFQRRKAERQARRDADDAWLREQPSAKAKPFGGCDASRPSYGGNSAGRT